MVDVSYFFNQNYQSLNPIDKQNYRHLLNLSSNESQHEGYTQLFDEFIAQYDSKVITKYPIFRTAHTLACKYHEISCDQLMLVPGSDFAINLLINALSKNAHSLITHTPNYIGYTHYACLHNLNVKHLPIIADHPSELKNLFLAELQQTKNCLVAITNPEGFFGTVVSYENMKEIAALCFKQNHILIIDEAYVEFNEFNHCKLIGEFSNVIIVRSYSKSMGLASMRMGTIIACAQIVSYLSRFASQNCISDISLSYLEFILHHVDRLKSIKTEVLSLRQDIIRRFHTELSFLNIYNSHTNFITLGARSEREAAKVVQFLLQHNIRVRQITEADHYKHCIRITLPAADKVDTLIHLLRESVIK